MLAKEIFGLHRRAMLAHCKERLFHTLTTAQRLCKWRYALHERSDTSMMTDKPGGENCKVDAVTASRLGENDLRGADK